VKPLAGFRLGSTGGGKNQAKKKSGLESEDAKKGREKESRKVILKRQ
jgi:hypothetical protein